MSNINNPIPNFSDWIHSMYVNHLPVHEVLDYIYNQGNE